MVPLLAVFLIGGDSKNVHRFLELLKGFVARILRLELGPYSGTS
jgi:hypothetical protein